MVGGALMAVRGELPVGATTAADADIRSLVERNALLPEALVILDATQSTAAPDVNSLLFRRRACACRCRPQRSATRDMMQPSSGPHAQTVWLLGICKTLSPHHSRMH